ncbi:hypothetical protein ACFPXP_02395, partial [Marinicrinis lubricantis]
MEHLTYTYDPVGNRTKMIRYEDADDEDADGEERIITDYAYDAINQLVQVQTQNGSDPSSLVSSLYSYDAVGNRLSKTSIWGDVIETETYVYDAADKLLE